MGENVYMKRIRPVEDNGLPGCGKSSSAVRRVCCLARRGRRPRAPSASEVPAPCLGAVVLFQSICLLADPSRARPRAQHSRFLEVRRLEVVRASGPAPCPPRQAGLDLTSSFSFGQLEVLVGLFQCTEGSRWGRVPFGIGRSSAPLFQWRTIVFWNSPWRSVNAAERGVHRHSFTLISFAFKTCASALS